MKKILKFFLVFSCIALVGWFLIYPIVSNLITHNFDGNYTTLVKETDEVIHIKIVSERNAEPIMGENNRYYEIFNSNYEIEEDGEYIIDENKLEFLVDKDDIKLSTDEKYLPQSIMFDKEKSKYYLMYDSGLKITLKHDTDFMGP